MSDYPISVTINGKVRQHEVEPRMLLADYIRQVAGLTGTHIGCEHGDGHEIMTVEGLSVDEKKLHPLQQAFWEAHGLQCGFCTPGFLMTLLPYLRENPNPSEEQIREAISGNLCRCTGYQHIVDAAKLAAEKMHTP